MILIADGGSTKVDWCLIDNRKEIKRIKTKGINPFIRTFDEINEEIDNKLIPYLKGYDIDKVYFFGAGCVSDKCRIIKDILSENITGAQIEVNSDLLAAARGLCGAKVGIACILGTGSNSCYYDGENITENISPLGYILGDEGSGAVLGRLFIGACLKNQLTQGIKEKFLKEYNLSPTLILDNVYRQPMPNRFLASISPFIIQNIEDISIYNLVYESFRQFFIRNIMQYKDYMKTDIHFTGSVAYYYQDILPKVATSFGIEIKTVNKSPMEGLIKYYSEI